MTREFIDFVNAHLKDDTSRLLLSAARYPSIDMGVAVQQIEGLRTAVEKWPSLLKCIEFEYPPRLNREQSSSEWTARHKAKVAEELCRGKERIAIADLTGGMGIDSIAFAQMQQGNGGMETEVAYVERNADLCRLMERNAKSLGLDNIEVHEGNSIEWLALEKRMYDIIYIDPARRSAQGRKVSAFEDCEPNILEHFQLLRSKGQWVMVKASPMIDLKIALGQLGEVAAVYIVSVKGECKEVVFVCGAHEGEPMIHCIMKGGDGCDEWSFTPSEEANAQPQYCTTIGQYLYEPDAALMKCGAFNLIGQRMGIKKLARNTHLYTSDHCCQPFWGRTFYVLRELKVSRKEVTKIIPEGKAHVVTRNYPVEAAALQRQLGLQEGGELYVVATTVGGRKTAFLCCLPTQIESFLDRK
jgi:hypothetical protein